MKDYLLLPLMLDILEKDQAAVTAARLKLPELYAALIALLQDAVTKDLARVRRSMREHGMRVYEEQRTKLGIEVRYLCRGYTYEFSILWGLVKAEIIQRLCAYLGIDMREEGMFL